MTLSVHIASWGGGGGGGGCTQATVPSAVILAMTRPYSIAYYLLNLVTPVSDQYLISAVNQT